MTRTSIERVLKELEGGLIVSCQAPEPSPLRAPEVMVRMAKAAQMAGACGIRAEGGPDIAAISEQCLLPLIGIIKRHEPDSDVYITPMVEDVHRLVRWGCPIIALDMTGRRRPAGHEVGPMLDFMHSQGVAVMADVATVEQGLAAAEQGADLIGTTLFSHRLGASGFPAPDIDATAALVNALDGVPVVAEGGYSTPADVRRAFDVGVHSVVVGRAVTDPYALAQSFVEATPARG